MTAAVVADGTDDLNDAVSYPLLYSLGVSGDNQAGVGVGVGRIEVVDSDTIRVTLAEGEDPVVLTSNNPGQGDGTYQGTSNGEAISIEFTEGSGSVLAYLTGTDPGNGVTAIYGFETPTANFPTGTGNVAYGLSGLAQAYIATVGDAEIVMVYQETATNPVLNVNFGTGAVSGTLFMGTAMVDADNDDSYDDALSLQVDISNGQFSGGAITGEVTLSSEIFVPGVGTQDLAPNVSTSSVDARLFGNTGNVIGGTFEATADVDTGEPERVDAVVGGTFFTVLGGGE